MTYSNKPLSCKSFGLENQTDFLKVTDKKINIDKMILEIEAHIGLKEEWNFDVHFKETSRGGPKRFENRVGSTAWLQMPKEYIAEAHHGWRKPLSSFHNSHKHPWTKLCKWTYRECKDRKFLNPACDCFWAFDSFCFDLPYTNSVLQNLGMFKSFIGIVPPLFAIENHQDPVGKLHIPLESNDGVYFSLDCNTKNHDSEKTLTRTSVHLPADGSVYYVNTRKWHSVVNMSPKYRMHIAGDFDHNRLNYV